MKKDLRGNCRYCPYYKPYENFCDYYKILLVAPGFEANCNNPERIIEEDEK